MPYSDTIRAYEKRRAAIVRLRRQGWSFARIGDKYGITRQRVEQICRSAQFDIDQKEATVQA